LGSTPDACELDSFVELRELDLLEERNGLIEGVIRAFHLFERSGVFFAWFFCHISSLVLAVAPKAHTSH